MENTKTNEKELLEQLTIKFKELKSIVKELEEDGYQINLYSNGYAKDGLILKVTKGVLNIA